jgi:hypothetical protein
MMVVYILTSDTYVEDKVVGVFDTRTAATKYKEDALVTDGIITEWSVES